ncbi:4'-phosphopantetheinyl transferase [Algibacter lectus]|uniref:4'-phosphopantetheinyl transferase family protein n=1 Tax=Algibacter lectus TaxID=221126 RepID=UPI0008ED01C5|nr:4'-phosphopantetheinyl transferase superfamily protein [Algibacter lectus]SFD52129.1 4'-phosphopantetheinyl transferase [Algibacter lectus]
MIDSRIKICCEFVKLNSSQIYDSKLDEKGVKLFKFKISDYVDVLSELKMLLNTSEIERAQRYYHQKDANRFIVCRGLLKLILAKEVGVDVSRIELSKDANKKPFLAFCPELHFNVSHAENYALIALGLQELGVDVEYLSKDFNFTEILPTVFSVPEINAVLTAENKNKTFYKFWTRKEAIVKATGKGIDDNLLKINVLDGGNFIDSTFQLKQNTQVVSFTVDHDYIGALAFKKGKIHVENIILYPLDSLLKEFIR